MANRTILGARNFTLRDYTEISKNGCDHECRHNKVTSHEPQNCAELRTRACPAPHTSAGLAVVLSAVPCARRARRARRGHLSFCTFLACVGLCTFFANARERARGSALMALAMWTVYGLPYTAAGLQELRVPPIHQALHAVGHGPGHGEGPASLARGARGVRVSQRCRVLRAQARLPRHRPDGHGRAPHDPPHDVDVGTNDVSANAQTRKCTNAHAQARAWLASATLQANTPRLETRNARTICAVIPAFSHRGVG